MPPPLPPLLGADELPPPVLRAAVLDGELYPVGEAFRPVDLPLDPPARAASLAGLAVHGRIIAGRTAAWVWGVGAAPALPYAVVLPHAAAVAHASPTEAEGVRVRTLRMRASDAVRLGGVPVTTPMRTAIDLLRSPEDAAGEGGAVGLVEVLARLCAIDLVDLRVELRTRSRLVGRTRALARLQVLVTR